MFFVIYFLGNIPPYEYVFLRVYHSPEPHFSGIILLPRFWMLYYLRLFLTDITVIMTATAITAAATAIIAYAVVTLKPYFL